MLVYLFFFIRVLITSLMLLYFCHCITDLVPNQIDKSGFVWAFIGWEIVKNDCTLQKGHQQLPNGMIL